MNFNNLKSGLSKSRRIMRAIYKAKLESSDFIEEMLKASK